MVHFLFGVARYTKKILKNDLNIFYVYVSKMILARATTAQTAILPNRPKLLPFSKSEEQVGQSRKHNKSKMAKGIELKIFPSFNQRHIVQYSPDNNNFLGVKNCY